MKFKNLLITLSGSVLLLQGCCTMRVLTINATVGGSSILGSESWETKVGGDVGASACLIEFDNPLSVSGGLDVSKSGAGWSDYGSSGKTDLLYVNAPFLLKYKTQKGFFGEAGLQPGLLLSAKDKYEGGSYDYMDQMNKFDIGIPLGLGYEFKNNLGVGLRIVPGLLDISKDSESSDRNFLMGIKVSYRIKLSK